MRAQSVQRILQPLHFCLSFVVRRLQLGRRVIGFLNGRERRLE
jgi:hypothetical protein